MPPADAVDSRELDAAKSVGDSAPEGLALSAPESEASSIDQQWVEELESQSGPIMDECGYEGADEAAGGAELTPSNTDCPPLKAPERPCSGAWGVLPGTPDVLVVIERGYGDFDGVLRAPNVEELRSTVCVQNHSNYGSIVEEFEPCGDSRQPGDEFYLLAAQRIYSATLEWYEYGDSEIAVGLGAVLEGTCSPPPTLPSNGTVELTEVIHKDEVLSLIHI